MGKLVTMQSHRYRKAAQAGFREWNRLFQSRVNFDENTKWSDLSDSVILVLSEENQESQFAFYDLLMRARGLGNGIEFDSLPSDRLGVLLSAYFFITDQVRFECMRRLGWLVPTPLQEEKPIIELVLDSSALEYTASLETPRPTPKHPAYWEDLQTGGSDRAALIRRYVSQAIRGLREKINREDTAR